MSIPKPEDSVIDPRGPGRTNECQKLRHTCILGVWRNYGCSGDIGNLMDPAEFRVCCTSLCKCTSPGIEVYLELSLCVFIYCCTLITLWHVEIIKYEVCKRCSESDSDHLSDRWQVFPLLYWGCFLSVVISYVRAKVCLLMCTKVSLIIRVLFVFSKPSRPPFLGTFTLCWCSDPPVSSTAQLQILAFASAKRTSCSRCQ